jgi:hypothetical protein
MTTQIPSPIASESPEVPDDGVTPFWDRLWGAEDPSISGVQPEGGPDDEEIARG